MFRRQGAVAVVALVRFIGGRKPRSFLALLALLSLTACAEPVAEVAGPLEGVWRLEEVRNVDAQGEAVDVPVRASLVIFGQQHYSFIWRIGGEANPPFPERWSPTDDEKVDSFNTLRGNSGTYELSDSTLTLRPIVARGDVMGGHEAGEFRILADTVWLTLVALVSADDVPHPFFAGGGRVDLKLVRIE